MVVTRKKKEALILTALKAYEEIGNLEEGVVIIKKIAGVLQR